MHAEIGGGTRDPYLELEYKETYASNRFLAGVRFSFFASFMLFFTILIGGYHYVWAAKEEVFGELRPYILLVESFFGWMISMAAWMIEKRTTALLNICSNHLMDLEREMGAAPGNRLRIQQRLASAEGVRRTFFVIKARHGIAIRITYSIIILLWVLLFAYSYLGLPLGVYLP